MPYRDPSLKDAIGVASSVKSRYTPLFPMKSLRTFLLLTFFTVASLFAGDIKALEAKVDAALAAYNAGDAKKFYADFSKSMEAITTPQVFDMLYTQGAKKQFGNYVSRQLIKGESVTDGDTLLLVYSVKCEKSDKVKLSINVQKEGPDYRFVQMQFAPQ
jgi:hypothetical protein